MKEGFHSVCNWLLHCWKEAQDRIMNQLSISMKNKLNSNDVSVNGEIT